MAYAYTNQLARETSPYLLQHAHNPVNWEPWGQRALDCARDQNKLIFLSIGYAACHWCHVMEHESFEDIEVAELLNRDFISIKVDREERPDIDEIYMTATMLYSGGHGGWPMSVFLAPNLRPIYAGTYFPKENQYGRPGFKTVLTQLAEAWQTREEEIITSSDKVVDTLKQIHNAGQAGDILPREQVTAAVNEISRAFDNYHGGIPSGSNKFPPSLASDLLLREYHDSGNVKYLSIIEHTLEKMGNGGIYDHLAGGIARYSTDEKWLVPHFEKILYDQALVATSYLDALQATKSSQLKMLFEEKARGILDYILQDLTDSTGAFYSSEDADSEGLEGKFYIWTKQELLDVLGEHDGKLVAEHFGVSEIGNWPHPGDSHVPHGPKNVLHVARSAETIANLHNLEIVDVSMIIIEAKKKLLRKRAQRTRPGLDNKILSGWNGLMITTLAKAAALLNENRYMKAANRAADFILDTMRDGDRLLATYGRGQARLKGYITDYAFLVEGLIELYQASGEFRRVEQASHLTDRAIEHYWDDTEGGFFFTASDHELLLVRSKTANDGAIPSGNSVMLANLLKLGVFLNRHEYHLKSEQIIRVFAGNNKMRTPFQHERLLAGIEAFHEGLLEIVIVGPSENSSTKALLATVHSHYLPNKIVAHLDPSDPGTSKELPLFRGRTTIGGKPTAYVCRNFVCQEPVTEPHTLAQQLWPSE
jgi:uncharacterized protein YyaL (SSP411 family)